METPKFKVKKRYVTPAEYRRMEEEATGKKISMQAILCRKGLEWIDTPTTVRKIDVLKFPPGKYVPKKTGKVPAEKPNKKQSK